VIANSKEPAGLGADVPGTRSESTDGRLAPCPHIPPVGHPHRPRAGDRLVARAADTEREGGYDDTYPDGEYVTVVWDVSDGRPVRYRLYGGVGAQVAPSSEPEPIPSRLRADLPTVASRRAIARHAAQKRLRIALGELWASLQALGRELRETARTSLLAHAVPPARRGPLPGGAKRLDGPAMGGASDAVEPRVGLAHDSAEPERCVRDSAGASRLQDALCRAGLAVEPVDSDTMGERLHLRTIRNASERARP
jgi:hypothetical protein